MALPEIQQYLKELQTSDVELYGVKLQKLNELTRKVSQSITANNCDEADRLLNSIEPTDFYSKRARLELANALQRPGPILEAFTSEDKVLIERALQFRWIYTGPTSILTLNGNNDLVKSVFPRISYSCRKRIIHCLSKFCKDEHRLDGVYQAIEEKYGIASAIKLLPACSESFIEPILMNEKKVQLTSRQLQQILERYPSLAISYLNKFYDLLLKARTSNKYLINYCYRDVLARLAKLSPEQFMDLYEKYGDLIAGLELGPRVSRALLNEKYVSRVIESASKYALILDQGKLMKRLDNEKFKSFFISLLPPSITSFQPVFEIGRQGYRGEKHSLYAWLQKFPKDKRFTVLEEAFENVYKKKLFEFPEFMTSRMIALLPKGEERDKWVDKKLTQPDSQYLYQSVGGVPSHREGFWEAFRSTEQSIPKLKGFLAVEPDIHRRAELISTLVLSCSINDDLAALEDVCKYVVSRFRNDHIQVRSEFLNALLARFDLLKLHEEHWEPINELLKLSSINNEFSQHGNCIVRILEKSIHYRLLKKLPVETQIQHYIKIQTRSYCWGESWNILNKHPELEKQCLRLFAQQMEQTYPNNQGPFPSNSSLTAGIISMAESFAGWNRRHPKDPMAVAEFPWLTAKLQDVLDGADDTNKTRVVLAFQRDPQAKDKHFASLLISNPRPHLLQHFLRVDPATIYTNTESILSSILRSQDLSSYSGFFQALLRQGHLTLSDHFLKHTTCIIEDEDEMMRKRVNAIKIASLLMNTEKFLEIAKKHIPEQSKVDLSAEDMEAKYELSKAVSGSLKNIQQPSKGLPLLLEFCKGDYLKLSLGSLYSLCYNTRESEAIAFLQEIVNRPVSVKKHAIRLMTAISNKRSIISFLKDLWESEKNLSIRNLIFQRIFEQFLFESSEDNWKLLKSAIQGLTLVDQNYLSSLGSLHNVEHIPDQFLPEYFQVSWQVVDGLEKPGPEIKWALASILQAITPDKISLLDSSFLQGILKSYLFLITQDQNLQSNVVYLAVKYLLYHRKEDLASEVNLILECIQQRLTRSDQWDKPDENIITLYPCKQALSSFIEQLCIESFKCPYVKLRDDARVRSLMEALVEKLSGVVNLSEIFIDSLFLRLSVIFHSRPEIKLAEDLVQMGNQVGKLADELIRVYQPEIIGIFSDTLKRFVSLCYKFRLTENEGNGGRIIHVVDGILHSTGSIDTQIIAAQFLSSTYPKPHVLEDEYKRLVTELRNIENNTVKIIVNYKLTQTRPIIGHFDMLV